MNAIWLTIILFLLAMPASAKITRPTGYHGAQRSIVIMTGKLEAFKAEFGRYPTTAEGLDALVKCPPDLPQEKWPAPPWPADWMLNDPWGHPYVYRSPGLHLPGSFDLYSCGRDGLRATGGNDADDVNNWDASSPHCWLWEYAMTGWQVPFGLGVVASILFLSALWKDLRLPKSAGNLHGILAVLLVIALGFPPMGLMGVMTDQFARWYFGVVVLLGVPAVVWLGWSGSRGGSPLSKSCATTALPLLLIFLVLCALLIPAEAST
jgi:general secretion pathway protein G